MDEMMDLQEAARGADGEARGESARVGTVSTDTRTIASGALFVALRGERFDGHEYLETARARSGGGDGRPARVRARRRSCA